MFMAVNLIDLEIQLRALSTPEKASLAHLLIEELDALTDAGAEQLWIEEAIRRYESYRKGDLEPLPAEDVMSRARERLR